jgi:hypothetical protein
MKKNCNCKQKQTSKAEGEKIVLELNSDLVDENICCFLCGNVCRPDGFDFVIEGTKDFVCLDCVKCNEPDLFLIHEYAHRWRENTLEAAFQRGVISGQTTAGQMILDAIAETELDRVKRVCRVDLGARPCREELPF